MSVLFSALFVSISKIHPGDLHIPTRSTRLDPSRHQKNIKNKFPESSKFIKPRKSRTCDFVIFPKSQGLVINKESRSSYYVLTVGCICALAGSRLHDMTSRPQAAHSCSYDALQGTKTCTFNRIRYTQSTE